MVSNLLRVGVDLFESRVMLSLPSSCIKSVIKSAVESYQVWCRVISSLVSSYSKFAVKLYQVWCQVVSSLLSSHIKSVTTSYQERERDVTN